jgi:hypothetical protein
MSTRLLREFGAHHTHFAAKDQIGDELSIPSARLRLEFPYPSLRAGVRGGARAASASSDVSLHLHEESHPLPLPVRTGRGEPSLPLP